MSERIVDTHKEIAAILETSVSSVRREVNTYPDPLPVRRFGAGRVWARRERLLLHRRRHATCLGIRRHAQSYPHRADV